MSGPDLRGCPECGTPVTEIQLGLRDYRWITSRLPGKVAPMDGDFILERNGDFLFMEFRQPGKPISRGKEITIEELRSIPQIEFWVVEAPDKHDSGTVVKVSFAQGRFESMTRKDLEDLILKWYDVRSKIRRNGGKEEG